MMEDLIARLETAETGTRELSDEVLGALGWTRENWPASWFCDDVRPCPTTILDAGLTLVPEGANWALTSEPEAYINLLNGRFLIEEDTEVYGRSATPALALCAAILRSKAA